LAASLFNTLAEFSYEPAITESGSPSTWFRRVARHRVRMWKTSDPSNRTEANPIVNGSEIL
jgi:hypothetical protein